MFRVHWFLLGLVFRPSFCRRVSALVLRRSIRELHLGRESIFLCRVRGSGGHVIALYSGLCSLLQGEIFKLFPEESDMCTISDFVVGFGRPAGVLKFGGSVGGRCWFHGSFDGACSRIKYFRYLCSLSGVDYDAEAAAYCRIESGS